MEREESGKIESVAWRKEIVEHAAYEEENCFWRRRGESSGSREVFEEVEVAGVIIAVEDSSWHVCD